MVGVTGFEPAASSSRTKRATKLRHTPWLPRMRPVESTGSAGMLGPALARDGARAFTALVPADVS